MRSTLFVKTSGGSASPPARTLPPCPGPPQSPAQPDAAFKCASPRRTQDEALCDIREIPIVTLLTSVPTSPVVVRVFLGQGRPVGPICCAWLTARVLCGPLSLVEVTVVSRARPASKRNGLIAKTTHSCCHCSGRRVRFTSCFRPLSLLTYPISNGNHPTYTLINSIFNSLPAAYAYSRIRSPASWDYLTAHRTTSSRSGCK